MQAIPNSVDTKKFCPVTQDEKYELRGGYVTQPLMTTSLDKRENLQYSIEHKGETIKPRKQWVWEKERLIQAINNNEIVIKKKKDGTFSVRAKVYLKDENGKIRNGKPLTILNGPFNQAGTKEVAELIGNDIYSFPKPSDLIKYLFSFTVNNKGERSALYLDFFSGSGTSAQAIMDLNVKDGGTRNYICVQMPELCDQNSEAFKAGYKTIAEICKERIRKVIKKIKDEQSEKLDLDNNFKHQDLGFKVFKLQKSNLKIWRPDLIENEDQLTNQLQIHTDALDEKAKTEDILHELILKSGVDLTAGIELKHGYYMVNGEIILALEKMDEVLVKDIIDKEPKKVIVLERLFKENDQLKTNTALQMKDADIDFQVI